MRNLFLAATNIAAKAGQVRKMSRDKPRYHAHVTSTALSCLIYCFVSLTVLQVMSYTHHSPTLHGVIGH